MILFKPKHVGPILSGQKTQTRRTGKKRWRVGSVHQCRLHYRAEPFARVKITGVRREKLGAISEADAKKEGYPSVEAYREAFVRIYGFWDPDVEVWVLDFTLCEDVTKNTDIGKISNVASENASGGFCPIRLTCAINYP